MAEVNISVILTSYNVERYILRALHSALSQHDVSLEVIAVDDTSSDDTYGLLESVKDPRLTTLRLPVNAGPSAARNAALDRATGSWIAVLDGDDEFLPGRLSRLLRLAKRQQPSPDILIDNLTVHREADGARFPMFTATQLHAPGYLSLAQFIEGNRLFASGYSLGYVKPIFSAAFLRSHALRYEEDIRIGEDYFLLAQALACGARCLTDATEGYAYTVRKGSISHRLTYADIERMEALDARFIARHPLDATAAKAQARRSRFAQRGKAFLALIDAIRSRDHAAALKAIVQDPTCVWLLRLPLQARLKRLMAKGSS